MEEGVWGGGSAQPGCFHPCSTILAMSPRTTWNKTPREAGNGTKFMKGMPGPPGLGWTHLTSVLKVPAGFFWAPGSRVRALIREEKLKNLLVTIQMAKASHQVPRIALCQHSLYNKSSASYLSCFTASWEDGGNK